MYRVLRILLRVGIRSTWFRCSEILQPKWWCNPMLKLAGVWVILPSQIDSCKINTVEFGEKQGDKDVTLWLPQGLLMWNLRPIPCWYMQKLFCCPPEWSHSWFPGWKELKCYWKAVTVCCHSCCISHFNDNICLFMAFIEHSEIAFQGVE